MSKLTHIATVLPNLSEGEIDKTEAELYDFIWRGPSPMAREEAKMPKHMGGIGFPCLRSIWTSVKVSWIRRMTNNSPTTWRKLLQSKLETFSTLNLSNILEWSAHSINRVISSLNSNIWRSVFKGWKETIVKDFRQNPEKMLMANVWGMKALKRSTGQAIKYESLNRLERANIFPVQLIQKSEGTWKVKNPIEARRQLGNGITLDQVRLAVEATSNILRQTSDKEIDLLLQNRHTVTDSSSKTKRDPKSGSKSCNKQTKDAKRSANEKRNGQTNWRVPYRKISGKHSIL